MNTASYITFIQKLCEPYGFSPKLTFSVPNTRSMISTLVRTKKGIILGNRFLYDGHSPELKHFPLKNTSTALIMAYRNLDEKAVLRDFVKEMTENVHS